MHCHECSHQRYPGAMVHIAPQYIFCAPQRKMWFFIFKTLSTELLRVFYLTISWFSGKQRRHTATTNVREWISFLPWLHCVEERKTLRTNTGIVSYSLSWVYWQACFSGTWLDSHRNREGIWTVRLLMNREDTVTQSSMLLRICTLLQITFVCRIAIWNYYMFLGKWQSESIESRLDSYFR